MDKHILDSLDKLINYIYDTEETHWEESEKSKDHIFNDIKMVSDWVDRELVINQ